MSLSYNINVSFTVARSKPIRLQCHNFTNWPLSRLPHLIWNSGILHNIRGSKPGQRGSDHGARARSQHGRRPWRGGGQRGLWWWASTSAWRGSWKLCSDKVTILSWVHDWAREPRSGRPAVKGFKYKNWSPTIETWFFRSIARFLDLYGGCLRDSPQQRREASKELPGHRQYMMYT